MEELAMINTKGLIRPAEKDLESISVGIRQAFFFGKT
jgi:hypothetical protein